MYDYYLGGKDNFAVDRAADGRSWRRCRRSAQLARRTGRCCAGPCARWPAGMRQFIDIGSGLPTAATRTRSPSADHPGRPRRLRRQRPRRAAARRALLATDQNTTAATADMRRPSEVLEHPETVKLLDFSEPVGVLMIAMVHFLTMEERGPIMEQLRDSLPSGSHLAATHVTRDGHPADAVGRDRGCLRGHADADLLPRARGGRALLEGIRAGTLPAWSPSTPGTPTRDLAPEATRWLYGGVGRKP